MHNSIGDELRIVGLAMHHTFEAGDMEHVVADAHLEFRPFKIGHM